MGEMSVFVLTESSRRCEAVVRVHEIQAAI
jgi:hypothetical protein